MPLERPSRRLDLPRLGGGLLLALAGLMVLVGTADLPSGTSYGIGPRVFPLAVAAGLLLLALVHVVSCFRVLAEDRELPRLKREPLEILLSLAGMIVLVWLGLGFILPVAIVFVAAAHGFGNRSLVFDLLLGIVLSTIVYGVFAGALMLSLPAGPIEQALKSLAGRYW